LIAKDLSRWKKLRSFWGTRSTFYRTLAKSIEKKELLRDFVEGEYVIAVEERTQDRTKASGLAFMRAVMEAGITSLPDVLMASMPRSDHMALATLHQAKDPAETLRHLASNIDQQREMSAIIRKGVIGPILLLPVGFAFAYILTSSTIPAFMESAPAEIWVGFNAFYRDSAIFFNRWGLVFLGVFLAFMTWLLTWGLANITGEWRFKAEAARGRRGLAWSVLVPFKPILTLYRDIQGTRLMADLAFMLQSGRLLTDAVETLSQSAQPWMRKHLGKINDHLTQIPGNYVGAFGHGILSAHLAGAIQSLNRVDQKAQFDQVLVEVGTTGLVEARDAVSKAAIKLNLVLMAGIMGLILYFYGGQMVIVAAIQEANTPSAIMKREAARQAQVRQGTTAAPSIQ